MWNNELRASARRAASRGLVACSLLIATGVWALVRYKSGQARAEGAIIFSALGVLGLWLIPRFLLRWSNPDASPAIVASSRIVTSNALVDAIDEDFEFDSTTTTVGWWRSVTLSDRWLLHRRTFGIDLVALDDLAWAYIRTVTNYNWWVPIGIDHSVVIRLLRGTDLEIPCRKQQADELIAEIRRRNDTAEFGYDPALEGVILEARKLAADRDAGP